MQKALVTGGSGFIGSHLVRVLRERGVDAVSYDLKEENDIFNRERLKAALVGVDTVFHLAALVSVPESMDAPLKAHATNVSGTVVVLEESRAAGVARVVYAGSAAVYGDEPSMPKNESSPILCQSPYALSKYMGEQWCRLYTSAFGFDTVVLRFMNVYGPGQSITGGYGAIIPVALDKLARSEVLTVSGDGTQTRDFVYVTDVVDACIRAAEQGKPGETYLVASGVETSINDIVQAINAAGKSLTHTYGPARAGDINRSVGDASYAKRELGWEARTSITEGIRRILEK
ncbi:MAG: hypothetical protein RLZZ283_515 [Candidatus Parcubacteria bacterium]|jgi:UDP-glucose 4-epimerase